MAIEVENNSVVCCRCGKAYARRRGNFRVSYASSHKGIGYIPICGECIDLMYDSYLAQCHNAKDAVRQMCRKLDLYWNNTAYESIAKKSNNRTMMSQYIQRISTIAYAGKSYDDTLAAEGTLWSFGPNGVSVAQAPAQQEDTEPEDEKIEISDDVIAFWGPGNTPKMYQELQQRYLYWKEHLPTGVDTDDIGVQALLRQICSVEIELNKLRAAGKSTDKAVNSLNTLLGSAMLKPAQKKDEADAAIDNTPFGVWIRKWEDGKPIPKPDPELEDVDGIKKYVFTWLHGHLCKMLGIKNSYSRLYDEAIAEMRVERPEFDDEDDEAFIYDVFSGSDSDD